MNNFQPLFSPFRSFFSLFLLWLLSACATDAPDKPRPDKSERPTIRFAMQGDTARYQDSILALSEKKKSRKDTSQLTQIIFSFPQIKNFSKKGVKDSLNAAILKMMLLNEFGEIAHSSLQARQVNFISEYETNKADMAAFGGDFDIKWFCEVKIQVLLNTPNLLTLRFFEANFTGGAHANMATRYLNFDMNTGQKIAISQLFAENVNYEKPLLSVAEAKFKQFIQTRELSPDEFEFEQGAFPMSQNIAVGKKGLILSYDPYELGAFALGVIELEITYEEIYPILNKKLLR